MQLNPQQQLAVQTLEWPMLIIAWAGSWKTATLTARIGHMIQSGIIPSSILALTFTNKAAKEMKDRTSKVIGREYKPSMLQNRHLPYIGTFHSFWIFVLKEVLQPSFFSKGGNGEEDYEKVSKHIGLKKDFLIYDESDKLSVLKTIIKDELWLIEKEYPPRQIAYYISDAKNKSIAAKDYDKYIENALQEVVAKVYERYEKRLSANNALDFDDILWKLRKLLDIPEILQVYQDRYVYIMIDEYQDTNLVQYEIVSLLAQKNRNLAVVGDDWQSIYSWRGADMRNILHFEKDYPDAKIIKLEQNYRSTKRIIEAANHIIQNNTEALKKELWTENQTGEKISYYEAPDDSSEANWIAENIQNYVKESSTSLYSDNLILYRTNAQSRSIEEGLLKKGIPYKVIGGLKFYDRKEIKDILCYLRIIHNPQDPVGFLRIINTPSRKLWEKTLETLSLLRENFALSYFEILEDVAEIEDIRPQAREALSEFLKKFLKWQDESTKLPLSSLIASIVDDISYDDYLRKEYSQDEYESKRENINELRNVASEYIGLDPRESLSLFLEEVALISDLDSKNETHNSVTLMTIHTAKWLEEKRVFVTGLEEGIFPHARTAQSMKELEEERRLMYVAMTRAREHLFFTRAKERFYFWEYIRNPESRFLREIPPHTLQKQEALSDFSFTSSFSGNSYDSLSSVIVKKTIQENNISEFKSGMRVEHHKFWIGIIESIIGEIGEIRFRDGIRKMNIRIAPLKIVLE